MADILYRGGTAAKMLEMEKGYRVIRLEFDRIYDNANSFRYLNEGVEYEIIVLGDEKVEKISLKVYKQLNNVWSLVGSDEGDNIGATVRYKPIDYGLYRFSLSVDTKESYANYCLMLATR